MDLSITGLTRLILSLDLDFLFFFSGSETRGTQWGEVNVGLFNKGLVVIPKGDQGNL